MEPTQQAPRHFRFQRMATSAFTSKFEQDRTNQCQKELMWQALYAALFFYCLYNWSVFKDKDCAPYDLAHWYLIDIVPFLVLTVLQAMLIINKWRWDTTQENMVDLKHALIDHDPEAVQHLAAHASPVPKFIFVLQGLLLIFIGYWGINGIMEVNGIEHCDKDLLNTSRTVAWVDAFLGCIFGPFLLFVAFLLCKMQK
jgi:hypothetical protein